MTTIITINTSEENMDFSEKTQRCHDYVEALEEERKKILVFQRELPLCLELVTQAIEAYKKELSGTTTATATTTTTEYLHGQSECSEQTTSTDGTRPLILEEFIPIKAVKNSSSHNDNDDGGDDNEDDQDEYHSHNENNSVAEGIKSDQKNKSEWLRSVQLWNQSSPDPQPVKEDLPRKTAVTEVKKNGAGAFQPFQKESSASTKTASASKGGGSSGGGNGKKEVKDGQTQRKQRRCWSPELHRRFLQALQQLGGSHVATPKQIRELMKVDGLTSDEVKSHLQKYRLHTRRPSPTIHNSNSSTQAPQFVVVGGIWVPPPEFAAVAAATASGETATVAAAAANGIYAPVAAPLPTMPRQQHTHPDQQLQSEGRGSHSGARSNSPATSSSTHTTTTSPMF